MLRPEPNPHPPAQGGHGPHLPVTNTTDDRSSMAKAYQWAWRIIVVSLEMVLPGLAGFWVDRQLGTLLVFLLVGLVLGCTWGIRHLTRMLSVSSSQSETKPVNKQ